MAIAIIKSIIRLFISLSYFSPYYIFLIVDERLTALNRNVALIIVGMMMIAIFAHLIGFTLQPLGSLKRNSTEQIKDTKVLRYFCSIVIFIMIVTTLPSLYDAVGLWVIPMTIFWFGCLLLFIYEGLVTLSSLTAVSSNRQFSSS